MDNHILSFVNYKYQNLCILGMFFRIISLLAFDVGVVFYLQILAPKGVNNFYSPSSDIKIYFYVLLAITAMVVITIISLYFVRKKWSVILVWFISNTYMVTTLFVASFFTFDGTYLHLEDTLFLLIKILLFIVCVIIYYFLLTKKVIKSFGYTNSTEEAAWVAIIPCLVFIGRIIINGSDMSHQVVLSTFEYLLTIGLMMHTMDLLLRTYYAKKYKIC